MKQYLLLLCFLSAKLLFSQGLHVQLRASLTFPGQTLANVWGYTAGGREYALVGASKGLVIVDITNPDTPQQIVQLPGPDNLWKEIKTYKHFAYVVSEGGQGIQIVDLSKLPAPNVDYRFYNGDSTILNGAQELVQLHALHIDTTKGYLYAYGGPMFGGGAKVFNLEPDPYRPVYVGKYDDLGYIHDGYVDNDTMYGSHIYNGLFSIVDMHDKSQPLLLGTQNTPGNFTHNTWISRDRKVIYATDEVNGSYLSAWDVSDPENIRFLDKIQSNPGLNSIVHNTHILDNYAVTSWYKDGYTIVDVTRPHNLVEVGHYDTWPTTGSGFQGCWGVYPYFPSGITVATNIPNSGTEPGELFVFSPTYVRAAYVEGQVVDAVTGFPIQNASVTIDGANLVEQTSGDGRFAVGRVEEGYFPMTVTRSGYYPANTEVVFERAQVDERLIELFPEGSLSIEGQIIRQDNLAPVSGADVWLFGRDQLYNTTSDAGGHFSISGVQPGYYELAATESGFGTGIIYGLKLVSDSSLTLRIMPDFRRDGIVTTPGSAFRCLPNPFYDHTTLQTEIPSEGLSYRICSQSGAVVAQGRLNAGEQMPQLGDNWPVGIYYFYGEGAVCAEKLIKLPVTH